MKKHGLKIIAAAAIVLGVLAAVVLERSKKSESDFNIILISIDTLRADHLGCYRYHRETSPAIDAFRSDAVLFRRCLAQSTSTLASHASIFTSLIPSHHGALFTRSQPLPEEIPTLTEFLRQENYRTVSFNDGGQIAAKFGLNRGFDLYQSLPFDDPREMTFQRIVDKAVEWLDNNRGEKFFLFLHTYETHHPYSTGKKHLELFESGYNGSLTGDIPVETIKRINKGEIPLNGEDKKHIVAAYDAEIRSMDESFGRFIEFLKTTGLYDNTLIIFTSDHGEEFGEHGIWATHSHALFNEQLHVPLIMKLPGSRLASAKVNRLARSIDILPTVLDLLGRPVPGELEGTSLLAALEGGETGGETVTIAQRDMQKTYPRKYWTIIKGNWKLYDKKLFDLLNDPGEQQDVSADNRKIKKQLEGLALHFMKRKQKRLSRKKVKLDNGLKKKLKTLGYLD
jgi:arylsulfatase A-like enzyme